MRTDNRRISPRLSSGVALWASAFVLAALTLTQASRLTGEPAHAEMVAASGIYTALTAEAVNDDALLVLDGRSEQLLVYRTQNRSAMELIQTYSLPRLFSDARQRALGRN